MSRMMGGEEEEENHQCMSRIALFISSLSSSPYFPLNHNKNKRSKSFSNGT